MPRYASRFSGHMTHHATSDLRAIPGPNRVQVYAGSESQCQGTIGFPSAPRVRVRCPHAARFVGPGALLCGNCARRNQVWVVD